MNESDRLVAITKKILANNDLKYLRLYRDKKKSGIDGKTLKFYGVCTKDLWTKPKCTAHGLNIELQEEVGDKYKVIVWRNQRNLTCVRVEMA